MRSISFFDTDYAIPDDCIAVATRAVKAEINLNFDCFTKEELKNSAKTYDGCDQVFVEHTYHKTDELDSQFVDGIDRSRSRGYVKAWHYDDEEGELYLLLFIYKAYANLCKYIIEGNLNSVSMGCYCTTYCSICGTEFDQLSSCECGACPNRIGTFVNGQIVYDILKDITYYEISIIESDPASSTALFYKVVA